MNTKDQPKRDEVMWVLLRINHHIRTMERLLKVELAERDRRRAQAETRSGTD